MSFSLARDGIYTWGQSGKLYCPVECLLSFTADIIKNKISSPFQFIQLTCSSRNLVSIFRGTDLNLLPYLSTGSLFAWTLFQPCTYYFWVLGCVSQSHKQFSTMRRDMDQQETLTERSSIMFNPAIIWHYQSLGTISIYKSKISAVHISRSSPLHEVSTASIREALNSK